MFETVDKLWKIAGVGIWLLGVVWLLVTVVLAIFSKGDQDNDV